MPSEEPSLNPAVDPQAVRPGEVCHVAAEAGPPPPVGDDADQPVATANPVSRGAFFALLVYASAVTAVCLGLLYVLLTGRTSPLESLPDVVPKTDDEGRVARVLVPADASVPPGHTLALGESRRFGDLLVTPLRVTREPLEFVHSRGEGTREPAGDVLKLWLRFENVGDTGRSFAPLDADLLFYRKYDEAGGVEVKANNYVAPAGDRSSEKLLFVYDHPAESDWDLAGQSLGAVLAPGESLETFVPSEVALPELSGPLAWRVQVRKGVARNGWGVTTLVEVTTPHVPGT